MPTVVTFTSRRTFAASTTFKNISIHITLGKIKGSYTLFYERCEPHQSLTVVTFQLFTITVDKDHHNSQWRVFLSFIHRFQLFPSHWQVSLICIPGATIERLIHDVELLKQNLPEKSQLQVVFVAGIYNLTKKNINLVQKFFIILVQKKIQSLIQIIQNTFHTLQNSNCLWNFHREANTLLRSPTCSKIASSLI